MKLWKIDYFVKAGEGSELHYWQPFTRYIAAETQPNAMIYFCKIIDHESPDDLQTVLIGSVTALSDVEQITFGWRRDYKNPSTFRIDYEDHRDEQGKARSTTVTQDENKDEPPRAPDTPIDIIPADFFADLTSPTNNIKTGDFVRLKSGGPVMKVLSFQHGPQSETHYATATVEWQNEDKTYNESVFPIITLEKIVPEKPSK